MASIANDRFGTFLIFIMTHQFHIFHSKLKHYCKRQLLKVPRKFLRDSRMNKDKVTKIARINLFCQKNIFISRVQFISLHILNVSLCCTLLLYSTHLYQLNIFRTFNTRKY